MFILTIIVFFMPLFPDSGFTGALTVKWYVFVGMILAISAIIFIMKLIEKRFEFSIVEIIIYIYLLLIVISTALSKHKIVQTIFGVASRGEGFLAILCYVLIFLIFSKQYRYTNFALKSAIIASICVGIRCVFDVMISSKVVTTGNIGNQNFLSSYICLFLPMLAFHYINTGKLLSIVVSLILFLSLIFSVTLGGYITFIIMYVMCIIYSLIASNRKKKVLINTLVLTCILVSSFIIVDVVKGRAYSDQLFGITSEVNNLVNKSNSFGSGRMLIWKKTLQVIDKNKLFGAGPGTLILEVDNSDMIEIIDKAHSEPLHIAANTGIPSSIVYLVFVGIICISLVINIIADLKKNKGNTENQTTLRMHMVLISILSYFAQSLINVSVVSVAPIYWSMLGIGMSIVYSNKKEIGQSKIKLLS